MLSLLYCFTTFLFVYLKILLTLYRKIQLVSINLMHVSWPNNEQYSYIIFINLGLLIFTYTHIFSLKINISVLSQNKLTLIKSNLKVP